MEICFLSSEQTNLFSPPLEIYIIIKSLYSVARIEARVVFFIVLRHFYSQFFSITITCLDLLVSISSPWFPSLAPSFDQACARPAASAKYESGGNLSLL